MSAAPEQRTRPGGRSPREASQAAPGKARMHPCRPMHRKSLAVVEAIRVLLEEYGRTSGTDCLRLEININHGVPSSLEHCMETRRNIPLEETR